MKPTCLGMPPSLAVFSTSVSHSPVVSRRYLVKPCNKSWDDGIVALEAGALLRCSRVLLIWTLYDPRVRARCAEAYHEAEPRHFWPTPCGRRSLEKDDPPHRILERKVSAFFFAASFRHHAHQVEKQQKNLNDIKIRCYLLTHAHLDHISSLVMAAGTVGGCAKRIYGSPQTLKDLETIFSDRVWPRLATYDETNPSFRLFYHA